MQASDEQQKVVNSIKTHNIIVDSVAGSGKTTTNIFIAQEYPEKTILLLTFNRKLSDETKERLSREKIENMEVYTYHGFCSKFYEMAQDDKGIEKALSKESKINLSYDIIIIDEAQDINALYYKLLCKIIRDNTKDYTLCILGDKNQSIYSFNGSDSRYLTIGDKVFNSNNKEWISLKLSTSYRLTTEIANFMNECVLNENRIISTKKGVLPEYYILDPFGYTNGCKKPIDIVIDLIHKQKYKPEDIFILAPSVKGKKTDKDTPLTKLENDIINILKIPIYIPSDDEVELKDGLTDGKTVFSSFHQSKGLERKVVICLGIDESYNEYFGKGLDTTVCPNTIYVALTRATEKLIIFHSYQKDYISFLNKNKLKTFTNLYNGKIMKEKPKDELNNSTSVTNFIKFLPQELVTKLLKEYIEETIIKDKGIQIKMKNSIEFMYGNNKMKESVSEINGIAIPSYYEYITKKTMSIINILQDLYLKKDENVFGSNLDFVNKINIDKLKLDDILMISNYYNSYQTRYIYKTKQITKYDWLKDKDVKRCIKNMKKEISSVANYELRVEKKNHMIEGKNLVGFIDCIDNNKIYEFKLVNELKDEHKIQLCIYIYLFCLNKKIETDEELKKYNFYLFNIKNNNIIEMKTTVEKVKKIYDEIVDYKKGCLPKLDEIFIEECLIIKNNYNINNIVLTSKINDKIKKYKEDYPQEKLEEKVKGKYMFIDIETNGCFSKDLAIIQIYYEIHDEKLNPLIKKNIYVNDGIHFTDYFRKIEPEMVKSIGLEPKKVCKILLDDLKEVDIVVGHNIIQYDIPKIRDFIQKYADLSMNDNFIKHDLKETRNIVKAIDKKGRIKMPKLIEIYEHFHPEQNISDELLHDASYDIYLTISCYKKVLELHNDIFMSIVV